MGINQKSHDFCYPKFLALTRRYAGCHCWLVQQWDTSFDDPFKIPDQTQQNSPGGKFTSEPRAGLHSLLVFSAKRGGTKVQRARQGPSTLLGKASSGTRRNTLTRRLGEMVTG